MSRWTSTLIHLCPIYTSADKKNKVYKYNHGSKYGACVLIKQVACKSVEEFQKANTEAEIAHNCPHANLCECYGCEREDRYFYIFFEVMDRSLQNDIEQRLECEPPNFYSEEELWRLFKELIKGYAHLQKLKIAHRDIKPQNILLGREDQVKICDFGFAKKIDAVQNTLLGTVAYFSPKLKQALTQGEAKVLRIQHNPFKSDVYSLGVVFIYLTLLQIPKFFASLKALQTNIDRRLDEITGYSNEWVNVLRWMLRVEEDQRPDFLQLEMSIRDPQPYADDELLGEVVVPEASEDPLQITLKCGLQHVRVSARECEEVPCMLSLRAIKQDTSVRTYSTDLVCVIDESKSMEEGSCMELVQRTLITIVDQMRDSDRLCLIGFSDSAIRKCPLLRCTETGKEGLKEYIRALMPQENTNIVAGLKTALEVLSQRRVRNNSASILLFTDGCDNMNVSPTESCLEALQAVQIEGLSVHCFGYGDELDTALLEQVAHKGNGTFSYIGSLSDIQKSFALVFGEITSVIARDIHVNIETLRGTMQCTLGKIYSKDGSEHFHLPDISANQCKDLIFFLIPPYIDCTRGIQLAVATATINYVANDGTSATQEIKLHVKFAKWTSDKPPKDREVFTNWYRVKGGEALREVREMANRRDFQGADTRLALAIEDLSSGGYAQYPMVGDVLRDLEWARALVQSDTTWRRGGDAHFASISYSHMSQTASLIASQYASRQQVEVMGRMEAQAYSLLTASSLHAYRQHEESVRSQAAQMDTNPQQHIFPY